MSLSPRLTTRLRGLIRNPASRKALSDWMALENMVIPLGAISNNDPKKDCILWSQGSLANQLFTSSDTAARIQLENFSTEDVPDAGGVGGVDYLIWASLDSSDGQYHFHVHLEDGNTREGIAEGDADFTDASEAEAAANTAISKIEPVVDNIRTYQQFLMVDDPQLALSAQITVSPSQASMNSSQSIIVNFKVEDCDGRPLDNVVLNIGGSEGSFNLPSVVTDANGEANATFTADNVTDIAHLTAAYFPYTTPTHRQTGSYGHGFITINNPGFSVWQVGIAQRKFIETRAFLDTTYVTGGFELNYTDEVQQSSGHFEQYVLATVTDSSIFDTKLYGGSGHLTNSDLWKHGNIKPTLFVNQSTFESGQISNDEDFTTDLSLEGYPNNNNPPSFNFISHVMFDGISTTSGYTSQLVNNQWITNSGSGMNPFKDYWDGYVLFQTYPPMPYTTVTYTGNNTGNYKIGILNGGAYEDSLITYSSNNHWEYILNESADVTIIPYQISPTSVKPVVSNVPKTFQLYANYPNPFNPSTMISYDVPKQSVVSLKVYDILGREITTLVDQKQNPGKYGVRFDASRLSSGVYLYRLQAGSFSQTKKLMLVK